MNIYVGNLPLQATEDDVREVFAAFGEVESVNIIKDKISSESRGFGFVSMHSKQEALTAIKETDGKDLKGKAVRVSEARGRAGGQRGGFQRGGGQRGGGQRGGGQRGGGGRGGRGGGGNRY